MHEMKEYLSGIKELMATGGVGLFGGISYYLYQISKGEKFRWGMFFINAFLAFWVATVIGDFIPANSAYRDGVIGISGFSSFPILSLLEQNGAKYILNKVGIGKGVK